MKCYFLILFSMLSLITLAQEKINVAERTFKANGTEDFYYAFAEGDQIVFDFEMLKGKEIKEIEIIEYPQSSKFMDYETKKIKNQVIQVNKTGIYIFRFKERGLSKKVCKFKIQRIPIDESTENFNTAVLFDNRSRTTYQTKQRTVIDKQYEEVSSSSGGTVTVSAQRLGLSNNLSYYQFNIPSGTLHWTYQIGVSQELIEAQRKDAEEFQKVSEEFAEKNIFFAPKTALAAFALGHLSKLAVSSAGESMDYSIVDYENLQLFKAKKGYNGWIHQKRISVDAKKITSQNGPISGTYYFVLRNNNQVDNIDVTVDIVTIKEVTTYKTETYQVPKTENWKVPMMADAYYKKQKVSKIYKSIEKDMNNSSYNLLLSKIKEIEGLGYDDVGIYNNIGYQLVLRGEFERSKEVLEYGQNKFPDNLFIQGNLAHCYLFTNEYESAKTIFVEHQYKTMTENLTWKQAVSNDFKELREKGINHTDMSKIETLLGI